MDAQPALVTNQLKVHTADTVACGVVAHEGVSQIVDKIPLSESEVRCSTKCTAVYLQDECLKHRFIRSKDTSGIVERPERLRAVKIGISAALARIEEARLKCNPVEDGVRGEATDVGGIPQGLEADSLVTQEANVYQTQNTSFTCRRTEAKIDLLNHPAVKYVHGDINGDVYLENLIAWARDSRDNIAKKGLEIPEGIPPLDLYLCPTSIDAIQGALGAVCEAVDAVLAAGVHPPVEGSNHCERAFVAVRPPGHHCGEDSPCGFCFVNNVVVGAAHAHLKHNIKRVIILDIDLHHGNGTQSLIWQINEERYRQTLESEYSLDSPSEKPGPQIYYGSLHDVLSFPCEDGKPHMVQAASTSIHGAHGQYIENIHLQRYDSNDHFWRELYPEYLNLLHRAQDFLDSTGGPGDDVLIFISCGFDACEHEYPSMSRHNRKVPVSFYHRFTRDTCSLADRYAGGRLVSVLEGGYSDRALISGAMAHICGLTDLPVVSKGDWVDENWWSEGNLTKLEKATKNRKAPRPSLNSTQEAWLSRTVEVFTALDTKTSLATGSRSGWVPPSSRTLRDRKKDLNDTPSNREGNPHTTSVSIVNRKSRSTDNTVVGTSGDPDVKNSSTSGGHSEQDQPVQGVYSAGSGKKLPRVILHVRPPANG
ncbi:hypothetical protein ID866_1091 [Astraeus odoratus]|nr:hypothetical protein ID866_1091 [Astraeus odoratus]